MSVSLPRVPQGDDPWTDADLAVMREALAAEVDELLSDLAKVNADLEALTVESGEGAGDDQADAGAATFEREHMISLIGNKRALLDQAQRALSRLDGGTYGMCENCGKPIPKGRMQARPKVTLCVTCQQREHRR
jgi:DnaK suppressor protein